jgi:hypothetical protein
VATIVTLVQLLNARQAPLWVMIGTDLAAGLAEYSEDTANAALPRQRRAGVDGDHLVTAFEVAPQLGEGALFEAAQPERRNE